MEPSSRNLLQEIGGRSHDDGDGEQVAGRDLLDGGQGCTKLLNQDGVGDVHWGLI